MARVANLLASSSRSVIVTARGVALAGVREALEALQRFAVILDRSALWSIDAYLEELRGKIGEAVKRAIPKSKVVWLNLTATRYRVSGRGNCPS